MQISSLKDIKKVHFIGIGGISMSGLAHVLLNQGYAVTGSDMKQSGITDELVKAGVKVYIGHSEDNIESETDLVVYTAAVKETNPEFINAKVKNINMIDRATLLGYLMKEYKYSLAISGTHGKTTTTSMVSHILLEAQCDPTISVGGILKSINGNIRVGNSDYFVTEACEYCDSFLKFFPYIAVILNVEKDHVDYFKNMDAIYESFRRFANLVPKEGALIINKDIPSIDKIISEVNTNVITYGYKITADYNAEGITYDELGLPSFDVIYKNELIGNINLSVRGDHNVSNALAAIATARFLEIEFKDIKRGLQSFVGTDRRFEIKGKVDGITIIDDYAHHPTEITATLEAIKKFPHNKLWCIFQSHTYTRTKEFLEEFALSLSKADNIIIADIYAAREQNTVGVYPDDIVTRIHKYNENAIHIPNFDDIKNYVLSRASAGDVILTMGAGNIDEVGDMILKSVR
ncbi:MAG TPA: UDP-N-acetylmuramate--L-alanine ligase [Clostridiales bacterium]|nr:MAG: UDP-N-acetylmuramate--L-alanine ligase [Clostridiales bacterium GWD2_32_19]HCC08084.1 UDP-N-acetylmuramate--L-alanine ligase [Clostridiales bacterium]